MEQIELKNESKGTTISTQVEIAASWTSRFKGLLGRDALIEDQCLVLYPCSSVHTCFMKFNIDVLFMDKEGIVLHLIENMPSFRFSPVVRKARFVIELPANTINNKEILKGDQLNITEKVLKGMQFI